ncbi:MAG TPA: hypothetical protein VG122_13590 [Gemmata sp.]|jgi:hypothetical protein|nr:hypothetical protein [Gemmata sp.]
MFFQSVKCGGRTHRGIGMDDIALIELLGGKTSAPRDVIERLDDAGYIDLVNRGGRTSWALTASGRRRAEALKPFEAQLRQHYSTTHTAGGCTLQCVSRPSFTMAPKSRRLS